MNAPPPLTDQQRLRYARQIALPSIGAEGQRRLLGSSALLVGCGALGASLAELLTRAGIGRITIVDRDFVEMHNLQRQGLFDESDARDALPKAVAARRRLERINSDVSVNAVPDDFNAASAPRILDEAGPGLTLLLDGTDNFEARYLLNDLSVARGVPYVYAGVVGAQAMQMTILPRGEESVDPAQAGWAGWAGFETPCLRCLFPDPPAPGSAPTCETAGVLNGAVAAITGFQAAEAMKVALGRYEAVARGLFSIDLESASTRRLHTGAPEPNCAACGTRRFPALASDASSRTTTLCGRNSVQILPPEKATIDLDALAARLSPHGSFKSTRFMLRGSLASERTERDEPIEIAVFPNARAIITGVSEPAQARAIYARYIGS